MEKKTTPKNVGQPLRKKDAMQLLTGQPVYLDDTPLAEQCLVVRLLRSPHANAMIREINTDGAMRIPGVAAVYTYRDVPKERYTEAGQTYPETSPHDRLILDRHLRHVGDPAAIIAAETEEAAEKALAAIRVEYDVLEPVLDFRTAKDNPVIVHPEEDWHTLSPFTNAEPKRNLAAVGDDSDGDVDAVLKTCDVVLTRTYHTKAVNQVPMETFRTMASIDAYGRLHIVSSTQIVFHVRRILSHALGIPKSKICVEKMRIGGGFGAKQTAVSEVYPAFVTWMTKRPSKLVYSRKEALIAGSPRHEMEITVTLGATRKGEIKALSVNTLSNTGAYGEHGWATAGLTGHEPIPLYTGNLQAYRFHYETVYTNVQSSGAYRGFGATQGIFAVETTVNELAEQLGLDPLKVRLDNALQEGQTMPAYYYQTASSCNLSACLHKCAEEFGWKEKYPVRDMGNGKVRTAGIAMGMQTSGITDIDMGSATVKLGDDGTYTLLIGAADMGTGCDTVLAQIMSDVLECSVDDISVSAANTDTSPYDSGSYASSTTFITGKAVELASQKLRENILAFGAAQLGVPAENAIFDGKSVSTADGTRTLSIAELSALSMCGSEIPMETTVSHTIRSSPPPFAVGMAEIELDRETGSVRVLDYHLTLDCGTVINPALARIQAEGGAAQAIGMALYEDISYDNRGRLHENSLMKYRIPNRLDIGHICADFAPSYEDNGPLGAKSIGEVTINTPAPAVIHAIYRATGHWFRTLPVKPEDIARLSYEKT